MAHVIGHMDHLRETTESRAKINKQLQQILQALLLTMPSLNFKANNENSPLFKRYLVLVQKYLLRNKEIRDKVKARK